MAKSQNDLGHAGVGRLLFNMALPAIAAQLINVLYNVVDRMYIGHIEGVGDLALTGVGVTFPVIMVISAFSMLVGMGGAPCASMKMGAKDNEGAQRVLGNCACLLLVMSAVITAVILMFGRSFLLMFGASSNTIGYAMDYLTIYAIGTIFVQFVLGLNPFISAQGFAKTSMFTTVIGAALNIALDPVFIFVLGMGVKGAALATILSQAVSAVWVFRFLTGKRTQLKIRMKYFRLSPSVILPVVALGVSPFIMQATESIITVCFNVQLMRYGGDLAVGAMTILSSVMQFVFLLLMGLTQGSQPIISFNYGAGSVERVKQTFRLLFIWCMIFAAALWGCVMLFPQTFVAIFSNSEQLSAISVWALRIYMGAAVVLGAQSACQQTFIALGQAGVSVFLAVLRKIILLIPLIFTLPMLLDDKVFAVFFAEPVADVLAATATVILFTYRFKRILKKKQEEIISVKDQNQKPPAQAET